MRVWAAIVGILFFTAQHSQSFSQQTENQILIRVSEVAATTSAPAAGHATYLNGYHSSINGETIEYHSSDPDAESALLVRGQRIAHSISWETDPIPDSSGTFSQFIWLAGIESAGFNEEKDTHQFDFLINGQRWFTFRNAKDSTAKNWKVAGKDGAELSFASIINDQFGDLFGYMVLKVSTKDFETGKPLTLEVDGDNSGSADWYMTFQHRFNFVPLVRAEPALTRHGTENSQVLRVSLDNLVEGRTLEVRTPNHEPVSSVLKIGANILRLPIPAATSETTLSVRFEINQKLIQANVVHVLPVKKREIYLLSYSHNDIGYTDVQPVIERKQWNNLEEAMRLIRETRDYPADSRYKWNLETIWSVDSYLKHASNAQREEFLSDVQQGSIGLSALYANMLTGLANSVEMSHFFDFARSLRTSYHIPMDTAVTSDVPGFSWGIVSALAQSGAKCFATAPNAGDRIGHTLETWGDKPFYWSSQSGQEKVLTWMAGSSYSFFHEGSLSKLGDEKIMKLLRKLDQASYPYEMIQLPYTLGDNGEPDPDLPRFVKEWNERYATPRLIIATHEQMFQEFEKRYGSNLPVMKGDFTPYWEDGAASTAFETALNRTAVDRLIQGEALWSMLSPASFPAQEYESAWRNVIFYDEHTWGAHNSIENPDLPEVKKQWEIKRAYALDADRASQALLATVLHAAADLPITRTPIDVYNTNSWSRTDIVFISPQMSAAGDHVVDSDGEPVPSQRLTTRELAVLVKDLPPFSSRRLTVQKGEAYAEGATEARENTLKNNVLALSVDPHTGAIDSLKWGKDGIQLVDRTRGGGLNQYLYVLGTNPADARPVSNVRVRVKEKGSLVASLLVEADAPGSKHYFSEIRLVAGIDRVDLITNLEKQSVREKEGVHIAFPFAVPAAQLRYDVANSVVRPEADQLPGSCKNFFSVQSWLDISNSDYGVTWATTNAPLVEIGAITAEQPWMKSIQPSPLIYSYVMNNYWHTNYKADQEGPITFTYSLLPHAAFDATQAVKFGVERRQPLIVVAASPSTHPQRSLVRLSTRDVIISSLKPIADGRSWLAYVYNPTGKAQQVRFQSDDSIPLSIRSSNADGQIGAAIENFEIAPFDSAYVSISRKGTSPGGSR